uniref:Coiled-coil domain containing 146 n=1 Tax=Oncorhynchus tshawytscha TaxID=74940 RepID=A0AAZ3RX92_ONCTS
SVSVCDSHLPTPALSSQRSVCLSLTPISPPQLSAVRDLSVTPISTPQLSAVRDLSVTPISPPQSEIRLLQEAKQFRAELERQQRDLETAEQFPEGPDTEVSRMRQQLLKFHNDLRQAEERDYQMNYQLECLTEEKLCLEKEYESQPKPVELEKRAKALKDSSEELRKEVSQRRQEIHSLLEDMEARHKLMTREQRELDHKKDSIVNNQSTSLVSCMSSSVVAREVEKSKAALDEQLSEVAALQKMTEARCRSLEEEKREVRRQVEGRRAHLEAAEREHSMLQKEQEMTKEKEVIMMGQRLLLLQRDVKPKSDRILKTRQEIQLEVDKLKRNLIHQVKSISEVETQLIEQCVEQEQELMRQSHRHREELHTLSCLTQIKADEREQKSRDRHRAEQRYHRIKQELRGKSLVIHELKKQNQEVQSRLGVFAKLYDNIKGDRNKCMNLIQMASQRTAEMREKFKILDNEIEILRTNAINKEKLLQKSRLKHFHSHTIRDSLRNDISKVTLVLHEMRQKREEQKLNLGRLTHMINYHEQNLLQMRKSHDNAVQSRNDRGVQLLEREEEMCIFYEKVNVQEGLIRDGNIEMQALEEETRCLQMITKEEGRQTALSRKLVPCQRRLKGESTMLDAPVLLYTFYPAVLKVAPMSQKWSSKMVYYVTYVQNVHHVIALSLSLAVLCASLKWRRTEAHWLKLDWVEAWVGVALEPGPELRVEAWVGVALEPGPELGLRPGFAEG